MNSGERVSSWKETWGRRITTTMIVGLLAVIGYFANEQINGCTPPPGEYQPGTLYVCIKRISDAVSQLNIVDIQREYHAGDVLELGAYDSEATGGISRYQTLLEASNKRASLTLPTADLESGLFAHIKGVRAGPWGQRCEVEYEEGDNYFWIICPALAEPWELQG